MNSQSGSIATLLGALVALIVLGVVGYVVLAKGELPDGPDQLVWDRTACATCKMHVGEPGFAAQARLRDGRTLAFDDPGCLFELLDDIEAEVHTIWFHHRHDDRWIRADRVAFVSAEPTPMGFGIAAVDLGDADARTFEAVRREFAEKRRAR